MKSVIIAAPMSGSGKTTITLGLMECLKRRGVKVAPFKVGPDFIDPGYHQLITGRPSINLDGWMCDPQTVREIFVRYTEGVDFAVIEGVMGLFDGIGGRSDEGSTAQIARLTGAPVVLVLDARGLARSAAAIVKGFAEFDPDVRVSGVIFNNVASENHAGLLREAVESALPTIRVLGCIPRNDHLAIPSRHLGLMTAEDNPLDQDFLDHLVEITRNNIDLGMFWSVATPTELAASRTEPLPERRTVGAPVRIGVARDRAFCFTYESNLNYLEEAGAELCFFSPLIDNTLPAGVSGLYLPGGYPELFADTLAANQRLKREIRELIEGEMPVYAECGGFIYLTRGVQQASADGGPYLQPRSPGEKTPEGGSGAHAFVGIFPVTTRMLPRRKALGYREIKLRSDTIIGSKGSVARGHEFHYSEMGAMPAEVERLYRVRRGQVDLGVEGYRYKNCLASYIHLHFGSNPAIAESFVESCRKFKS